VATLPVEEPTTLCHQSLAFQRLCGFFYAVRGWAAACNRCDVARSSLDLIGPVLFHHLPLGTGSGDTRQRKNRRVRKNRTLRYLLGKPNAPADLRTAWSGQRTEGCALMKLRLTWAKRLGIGGALLSSALPVAFHLWPRAYLFRAIEYVNFLNLDFCGRLTDRLFDFPLAPPPPAHALFVVLLVLTAAIQWFTIGLLIDCLIRVCRRSRG
jgi:hypothetical protein